MKPLTLVTFVTLVTSVTSLGEAQLTGSARIADSVQRLVDNGRLHGSVATMRDALILLDRGLTAWPDDGLLLHYKGFALYLQSTMARAANQADSVSELLEQSQDALERSGEKSPIPETFALLSAVMGQRIGGNPIHALTLGPRAGRAMARAHELGPQNPRVWMLDGIGAMYTPAMFGGGMDKAEVRIRRAVELYERDAPAPPAPRWGRAEAHAWLGQIYHQTGRDSLARVEYQAALQLEPENGWVRYSLLPGLDRPTR